MIKSSRKNIYFDFNTKSYRVYVDRNKRRFSARARTLEDAIALRNEVIEFYSTYQRFPHRSELKTDTRMTNKKNNYGTHIILHSQSGLFRFSIDRNRVRFSAYDRDLSKIQSIRDKVIEFYQVYNRLPSHEEVGFKRQWNRKRIGDKLKYITKQRLPYDLYAIRIIRSGASFLAHSHTESEAIQIRDDVLEFYRTHKRLPSHEEIGYIPLRNRK